MTAVLLGFTQLISIAGLGYLLGRKGVLGHDAASVLSRLAFYAAAPALMFVTVAHADIRVVLSAGAAVSILAAVVLAGVYFLLARLVLRTDVADATLGALTASYVNAGNLGIPILTLVVGDAALIAPILLFQLLVLMPLSFAILDAKTRTAETSLAGRLSLPLRNPLVVGVGLGLVASATDTSLPEMLGAPVELLGDMAIPLMLIAFGLNLRGFSRVQDAVNLRQQVLLAVILKNLVGPVVAYAIGAVAFDLSGPDLLAPVIISALPSAQNLFVYAMRYRTSVALVQAGIVVTTAACIPVIVTLATLMQ